MRNKMYLVLPGRLNDPHALHAILLRLQVMTEEARCRADACLEKPLMLEDIIEVLDEHTPAADEGEAA